MKSRDQSSRMRHNIAARACSFLAILVAAISLIAGSNLSAQESPPAKVKLKNRSMFWNPPDVDSRVPKLSSTPPCDLASLLKLVGEHMQAQEDNLPNFTADERIQFQMTNNTSQTDAFASGTGFDTLQDAGVGTFEYLALISNQQGGTSIQETRTPKKGTQSFPASSQDVGLPELDFILLPKFQGDYEMACEGLGKWDGQDAWVIHFQQRPDKIGHALSFRGREGFYSAKLKGRAWITADTMEVIHLELAMMEAIPQVQALNWWLSLDYAPVQFHSQDVKIWLPQTVDAYARFTDHRTMIYHTFTNFLLFSVQTKQEFQKPNQPQKQPQN